MIVPKIIFWHEPDPVIHNSEDNAPFSDPFDIPVLGPRHHAPPSILAAVPKEDWVNFPVLPN